MTEHEFTQIMREAGYEDNSCPLHWRFKKNQNFWLIEDKKADELSLGITMIGNYTGDELCDYEYIFKDVSKMNSITFKKQLEGITEYAYSLYKDINRHIDAISKKMETKAKRLGM